MEKAEKTVKGIKEAKEAKEARGNKEAGGKLKSGFVTLIGRPNAGKSTLLNQILGRKVAIVSEKPQTTRNIIRGIYNTPKMQAIFMDTPGIHKPKHKLDHKMMEAARSSLAGGDIVFYLVDANTIFGAGEEYILKELAKSKLPVFLLINKVDLLTPAQLLPLLDFYSHKFPFVEIVPISASRGDNIKRLLEILPEYLPEGPRYYPREIFSDQPEQLLLAELIREQVLSATEDEIPHSTAVTISEIAERSENLLYVEANIYVERDSQKGIIIGKNGAMLKKIGTNARREMERLLGCKIYLEVRVKAKKDWRNNEKLLQDWDPDKMS